MGYIDHRGRAQFDHSHLQNSKLKFQKGHRAKPIYHYTSIGGLESILRNKTLRFTNIKYMNDKDEIIAGLDSIAKDCHASEETRKQLRSAITNLGMQIFVCCFSLKEDSLPMWNYYTKEGNSQGYNIEFDDKKLVESILRSNPVLDGCYVSFGNVDYSKDNNSKYSHILTSRLMSVMDMVMSKIFLIVATGMSKKQTSAFTQINDSLLQAGRVFGGTPAYASFFASFSIRAISSGSKGLISGRTTLGSLQPAVGFLLM